MPETTNFNTCAFCSGVKRRPCRPFALTLPFLFSFVSLRLDFDVLIGTSLAGQNDRPSRRPTSLNSRCLLPTFRAENRQNVRSYDT